jgi:hypothetical protein
MKTQQQQPKVTTTQGWSFYNLGGTDRGIETNLSEFPQLWKILLFFLATRQEENVGSFGGPGLHYSFKNCHHPSGQPPVAPWIKPRTCDQPSKRDFATQGISLWRKFHYLAI